MFNTAGLKSQTVDKKVIDFCLGLSSNLLTDILQQAGLDPKRDLQTLVSRTHREGLGFLTKTLPNMGKAIQLALQGNRLSIPQFSKMRGTVIPHFMKGLLSRCFHDDGEVRENIDFCALTDLIQFCFLLYKLEVPYDPKTIDKVLHKFVNTDAGLPKTFSHLGDPAVRLEPNILDTANDLIKRLFVGFHPEDVTPRHGPGAVATGEKPHQKMQFKRIYDSVEEFYPAQEYYFLNGRQLFDDWERYWSLDHIPEPTAKVALVPKDSRGPRLISAEPLELQFIQQGLGKKLVAWIERHPLTRGHVNFTDQGVNRQLALRGSIDGKWSTLDLSDASDRVSLALVERVFAGTGLFPFLQALRSTSTTLPDGRVVRMRKYAPMGSALCFPVEALCFWALAAACVHVVDDVAIKAATKSVYVYGDDIIVKGGLEQSLLQYFHYFGLRLNDKKCCYSGLFRESCGIDAYRGHIVTPIKVKRLPLPIHEKNGKRKRSKTPRRKGGRRSDPPLPRIDGAQFASWVAVSNLLFQKGYYRAADYVKNHVERAIGGFLPMSKRLSQRKIRNPWEANMDGDLRQLQADEEMEVITSSAPTWSVRQEPSLRDQADHSNSLLRSRFNRDYQRTEFRTLVLRPVTYINREGFSDWSELHRHILADLRTKPYLYTFLRRVKLTRRWVSLPY